MKFLIQRVSEASVTVDNEIIGKINEGFLVFIGIAETDTQELADKMIRKMLQLRIFEDDNGKTNLSLQDKNAEILLISQFTLYAECKKGNRPSFIKAGNPTLANELYLYIIEQVKSLIGYAEAGRFGADMKINLQNDGPFTILLDSDEIF